jgi:hypothetical protein
MRVIELCVVGAFGVGLGGACTDNDPPAPPPEPEARATWYQDVAPILANHCMTCHQDGGIGPFLLTDYDSAKEHALRMVEAVEAQIMPPFDAREADDCTPRFGWVDDPRLSDAQKQTLQHWIDDGYALGVEEAIPAIPNTELQNVSMTLTPAEGWPTSGDQDQFICFILDPGNTQLEWLTGLQINPDIDEVVHHAVLTEIGPGAAQDQLVAQRGIGRPFDCNLGMPSDFTINVWTPGNQPFQTSDQIAVPIVAGAKLIMQIHYHPAGSAHAPDKTSVSLRFGQTWPERMYFVTAFGNEFQAPNLLLGPNDRNGQPEFRIPRDVADHTERMRVTIPDLGGLTDVRLFSANPHMHLIGTRISSTIERPAARGSDPQTECLANGAWNFDWQRTYQYDAPLDKLPGVLPGDVIEVSCDWNNTLENPFVQRMLADSGLTDTIDVLLGEQTTNEMCLEIFGLSIPAPAEPANGKPTTIAFPEGLAKMSLNPSMLKN